ncbi:MAG: hypothetical protein A3H27_09350 [Acidobacteria bacterium RIFCSPLOWO2_02_FULL_59_13]|nr:MAG: hypothetical protein A3H27_09350 [Acidobacteria bacterium RIFCSPLOWO2_02_FULL_59_13]
MKVELILTISAVLGGIAAVFYLVEKLSAVEWRRPTFSRSPLLVTLPPLSPSAPLEWPRNIELRFPAEVVVAVHEQLSDLRLPMAGDIKCDWAEYGDPSTLAPFFCSGDFTGSGQSEYATFVLNGSGHGYRAVAFVRDPSGRLVVHELQRDVASPTNRYVTRVAPGTYRPGPSATKLGSPSMVRIRREGINLGTFESADALYYWNKKKQSFTEVWMSD